MRPQPLIAALALVGAASVETLRPQSPETPRVHQSRDTVLAITGVTVVDVAAGRLRPRQTIVVRGNRIASVGPAATTAVPPGAIRIDGRGRYALPGLWDMHVHVLDGGARFFPLSVAAGVTGLRDMGGWLDSVAAWRDERRRGRLMPRIVAAVPIVTGENTVTLRCGGRVDEAQTRVLRFNGRLQRRPGDAALLHNLRTVLERTGRAEEAHEVAAEPEVRPIPRIWHLTLAPVIASFVQAMSTTHGLLALLDESESALVLAAAYSIRPVDLPPLTGTALPLRTLGWLEPALRARQPTVVSTRGIAPSPLVPPGSSTVLIAPVATSERVHGVAILGEQRSSRAGVFASAALAQGAAEARQIALVVESLRQLDRVIREKRNEMVEVRLDLVHALLTDVSFRARRHRKSEPGRERLRRRSYGAGGQKPLASIALDVADVLKVPAEEREVLRQALDVEDIGRTWLEHTVFPRMTLAASVRDALLDSYASHSAEMLSELDWPAAVVDLVRLRHARWDGDDSLPLAARILAVAGAYGAVAPSEADAPNGEAIAELERQSGSCLDPAVVAAFVERLAATSHES